MNFFNKVNNGMSPKDAYLEVLQNDFSFDAIPNLNNLPVPYYMKGTDYFKALSEDIDYFAKQNEKAAEIFNKSNKTHADLQRYISDLAQLDFVEDIEEHIDQTKNYVEPSYKDITGAFEFQSNFSKDSSKEGLGLGLFIGKTLLEKNFASVNCRNSKTRSGAEVNIKWNNRELFNI